MKTIALQQGRNAFLFKTSFSAQLFSPCPTGVLVSLMNSRAGIEGDQRSFDSVIFPPGFFGLFFQWNIFLVDPVHKSSFLGIMYDCNLVFMVV